MGFIHNKPPFIFVPNITIYQILYSMKIEDIPSFDMQIVVCHILPFYLRLQLLTKTSKKAAY